MGVLLTSLAAAVLGSSSPAIVTPQVIDAALFKNGYSVIALGATIPDDGSLVVEAPRDAVLGTFWLRASDGKVLEAVASNEERVVPREPKDFFEILNTSIGKQIHVSTNLNGLNTIDGELVKIGSESPTASPYNQPHSTLLYIRPKGSSNLLVIPSYSVVYLSVAPDDANLKYGEKILTPVIRIQGLRGTHVVIDMVKAGLWWSPAYSIDISDNKNLKLNARAVIVNDMYDLSHLDLKLVTGFPNLPFLGQTDPMQTAITLGAVMQDANVYGARGGGGFGGGGMQMQLANRASFEAATPQGISSDDVKGFSAEDLFMYPQKDVSLKKGDRMYRQLFDAESPYEHVYTLTLEGLADASGNRPNSDVGTADIWHEIKFKNTANLPLTTAPATVTKDGSVVGQDTLTYTSLNQEVHIKITKAVDISAHQTESEVSRDKGFVKDITNNYPRLDRVHILGTVEIFNRKPDPVTLEITKTLYGEVESADNAATWSKFPAPVYQMNDTFTVKWRVTLPANQLTKVTYHYATLRPTNG